MALTFLILGSANGGGPKGLSYRDDGLEYKQAKLPWRNPVTLRLLLA
uniref:Uncharacterized protein LOC106769790 n=1 Tax=Rhizophora mucronata TaxID=61149 RepID=A0A2P2M1T4_RHIMU